MKQAAISLIAIAILVAQDAPKVFFFSSPTMGKAIKGAPYSADEVNESLQVLADGTRIAHQSKTTVYRDSEGRVRRESPNEITILDPVAGVSYTLRPETKTAIQGPMSTVTMNGGRVLLYNPGNDQSDTSDAARRKAQEKKALDELQASVAAVNETLAGLGALPSTRAENLGQQMIEGVNATGNRTTRTIAAGADGNDRPIHVVEEHWESTELQTTVMTKHSDPRTGEQTFRLTNISRSEPPAFLFMVPAGYTVISKGEPRKEE